MAAVQKHIILAKHVFKQYNIPNDTYSCLWGIFAINFVKRRRKSPGLEMKNAMGSDVVTKTKISKIEN